MIFHILFQFYVFLDFRFYLLSGFFMLIKRVDFHSKPLFNLFLALCKKVSNLEALRIYIWILKFLFKNHFNKQQQQTHLHFCFSCLHSKFFSPMIGYHTVWYTWNSHAQLLSLSFASMSYNPDTRIKDHHFSLKLQNSAPQKLRTLKYPSLGNKRSKIEDSPKGGHLQLADKNHFPDAVR